MTVLSGQSIRTRCFNNNLVYPFVEKGIQNGKSFGLSQCGYDIRVKLPNDQDALWLYPGDFVLVSSFERIRMPNNLVAIVHDKSSWARQGLALQNTVLEPGWEGWITLELSFHKPKSKIIIRNGDPIAQLLFHQIDYPVEAPYQGKYQNQPNHAVEAIEEPIQ